MRAGAYTPAVDTNVLYYGDNLDILRRYVPDASVDLVELSGKDYPRLQILTIRELLEEHRKPDLPLLVLPTYQRAERVEKKVAEQGELFG